MNDLQKMGGIASIMSGLAYIIGFAMALTLLAPMLEADPSEYVAFLADNLTMMYLWHLIIYVFAGSVLVVQVVALHERLKDGSSGLMQVATAFGLIWAGLVIASGMLIILNQNVVVELYATNPDEATSALVILQAVESALGGGIELPGGLWILLLSWAALRTGGLPRFLNYLGIIIGIAGIITVVPALGEVGAVFGLGFIPWFIWAGIVMLRDNPQE